MANLLSVELRKQHVTRAGSVVLAHATHAPQQTRQASDPLDVKLPRGFYRIVQKKIVQSAQGETYQDLDASLTVPPGASEFPVQMENSQGLVDQVWYLNAEYGVKNGFSITPVITPGEASEVGGTAYDNNNNLVVKRSPQYPVWVVRCDESITYRKPDGTYQTEYYFRILGVGTDLCWKTGTNGKIEVKTKSSLTPIPPSELYEVVPCLAPVTVTVTSNQQITVTANNAEVQRRLWFTSGAFSKNDLPTYVSVQLTTDARDQGWASNPNQGLWSWFELAVLDGPTAPNEFTPAKIKKAEDGTPLTFVSHTLNLNGSYNTQTGKEFGRDEELWKYVAAGNVIAVLACAQFPLWKCDARSGKLDFKQILQNP